MADKFITDLTENTAPLGSDLDVLEDDPAGTPLTQKIYKGANNLLPDGYMLNGKIAVTVASNDITVALKTKSGGNPSATDPVSVWINGTYRRCTAALSVTKADATNWFASGSADLATKEIDYFAYLIWNTTPATDIMDIGFARISSGRVYSEFSGTSTNEKYLAFGNASTPTSTDDCVVIGRFAATLSAGAGYTWTVPTFTHANLIQVPIYETRWLDYLPTVVGFSSDPTFITRYQITRNILHFAYAQSAAATSDDTAFTVSIPFTAKNVSNYFQYAALPLSLNNSATEAAGLVFATPNSAILTLKRTLNATWTASGTKNAGFTIDVEF